MPLGASDCSQVAQKTEVPFFQSVNLTQSRFTFRLGKRFEAFSLPPS